MKKDTKSILLQSNGILWIFMIGMFSPLAFSEEVTSQEENIWKRAYLGGDWGGMRSGLADHGVNIKLEYTAVYQDLISGDGVNHDELGGKIDAFINLDSEKLGLWEGGGFNAHLEYINYNPNISWAGALYPMNMAFAVVPPHEVEATSLYFTQKISDKTTLMLGKINALDLLASDPFFGGWGTQRFMNLAFVAPVSGVVPPVFMGTIVSIKTQPVSWTFMLFDPNNRATDYFPDDLFSDGVNMSVSGNYASTLQGRKTDYKIIATYSTKDGTDFSTIQTDLETTDKEGSYNISFQFSHNLQESAAGNWGIYLKAAIADGNPNLVNGSIIGGISGSAFFFNRPEDTFGIGYYYYDFSNELQESTNLTTTDLNTSFKKLPPKPVLAPV